MKEKIKIELCGGKMPEKAHATDAAFDVFTREDVELVPYLRTAYLSALKYSYRHTSLL